MSDIQDLVAFAEFDLTEVVKVVGAQVQTVRDKLIADDFKPLDLAEIRDDVMNLTKFGAEVGKLARELREDFDNLVKLMYEIDQLTPAQVQPIHTPTPREGAGRKPMTPEERIKAAQKRLANKDS